MQNKQLEIMKAILFRFLFSASLLFTCTACGQGSDTITEEIEEPIEEPVETPEEYQEQIQKDIKTIVAENYPKNTFVVGATLSYNDFETVTEALFLKDFDYATSRNFAKQPYVHPEPGVWRWGRIEQAVSFADANNIQLRLHSPISPQASKWALNDDRTAEELSLNMEEYMTALCNKINVLSSVKWMDVVNETIERDGNWFMDKPGITSWENPWVKMGYDANNVPLYITKAFEISNELAPNVGQIYNQHGGMEPAMWEKVKETILYLKSRGIKIDGLGWQCHLKPNSRVVDAPENLEYLANLIDWAHANDLSFHITEMDYHIKSETNFVAEYSAQADAYTAILEVLAKKTTSGLVTCNFWGITDKDDAKNTHRYLYDEQMKEKPVYHAIKKVLYDQSNNKN